MTTVADVFVIYVGDKLDWKCQPGRRSSEVSCTPMFWWLNVNVLRMVYLHWNWLEKMLRDEYMLMIECNDLIEWCELLKECTGGLRPKIENWKHSRLYFVNEIIDMDIYMLIYYFDRVDPNCTFRWDCPFLFRILLILMRLCWFVCIDLHIIHVVACQDVCEFIHAYRKIVFSSWDAESRSGSA